MYWRNPWATRFPSWSFVRSFMPKTLPSPGRKKSALKPAQLISFPGSKASNTNSFRLQLGGGTGPYSFWLAELGYETHLIDQSERLIQLCRDRVQGNAQCPGLRSVELGDARS